MKYLKVFETEALQNEFRSSQDYIEPHVSCLINGENVKYNKSLEQLKTPFTIEATQDGTTIYFRQSHYAALEELEPLTVEVSMDNGETWTEVTAATSHDNVPGAILAELDEGDWILIRGKNDAYGYYSSENRLGDWADNCNFWADNPCYVYGNIMSLIDGNDSAKILKVKQGAFAWFFSDYNGALDWSWVLSKNGEKLLLPATTLAESCYHGMFYNCSNLTIAPNLPATTLAEGCYNGMFANCTGLTIAPELPAITLAELCYNFMFYGCTNISYIKAMFTTTPGNSYTAYWVSNVNGTGTFVKNAEATWNVTGNNGVPTGWTVETASA